MFKHMRSTLFLFAPLVQSWSVHGTDQISLSEQEESLTTVGLYLINRPIKLTHFTCEEFGLRQSLPLLKDLVGRHGDSLESYS
jgi:hypothetical protein